MLNVSFELGQTEILPSRRQVKKAKASTDTKVIPMKSSVLLVSDALEDYLKQHAEFRKRTVKDYQDHFRYLQSWASEEGFSIRTMADFTEELVKEYRSYMIEEYSGYTVNVRLRTLRAFLGWAHGKGYVPDLMDYSKLVKVDDQHVRNLTDDEIHRLLLVIDKKSYEGFREFVLIVTMLDTGIRISELLSLTWDMIRDDEKIIELPGRITKNKLSRKVPLTGDKTVAYLRELLIQQQLRSIETHYVFTSELGYPLSTSRVRHILLDYSTLAGIQRLCPHMLRHTFARLYVRSGGNVFVLQEILGHTTLKMSRRYVRLFSGEIVEEHQRISHLNQFVA